MPDFLPRRGADLVRWSINFDQKIRLSPESYGITPEQSAHYSQLNSVFANAFQRANQGSTDSTAAKRAKLDAEKALRDYARVLAGVARSLPQVSDLQLVELGLRVRRGKGTKIPRPDRAPWVQVVGWPRGRTVTVQLRDPESPTRKGMPKDICSAEIYTFVGESAPPSRQGWRGHTVTSKARFEIEFPELVPPGAKVWIAAKWGNAKAQYGPCGAATYTHLGFGIDKLPGSKLRAA